MNDNELDPSQNNTPDGEAEEGGGTAKKHAGSARTKAEAEAKKELQRRKKERADARNARRHHADDKIAEESTPEESQEGLSEEEAARQAKKAAMEKRRAELQAKEARRNQRMMAQFGHSGNAEQPVEKPEKSRKKQKAAKPESPESNAAVRRNRRAAAEAAEEPRRTGKDAAEELRRTGKDGAEELRRTGKEAAEELRRTGKDGAEELRRTGKEEAENLKRTGKEASEASLRAEKEAVREVRAEGKQIKKKAAESADTKEKRKRTPEEQMRIAEIKKKKAMREHKKAGKDGIEGLSPEDVERRRRHRARKAAERAAAMKAAEDLALEIEDQDANTGEEAASEMKAEAAVISQDQKISDSEEKSAENKAEDTGVLTEEKETNEPVIVPGEISDKEEPFKAEAGEEKVREKTGKESDEERSAVEESGEDAAGEKPEESDKEKSQEEESGKESGEEKSEGEESDEEESEEEESQEEESDEEESEEEESDEEESDEEESDEEESDEEESEEESEEEEGKKKKKELTPEEKKKRKRFWGKVRRIIGCTVLALIVIYAAGSYFYMNHFYPHTTLNGCNVSNRSVNGVRHVLKSGIKKYTAELVEKDGSCNESISAEDMGIYVDWDKKAVSSLLIQQAGFDWIFRFFDHQTLTTETPLVTCEKDTALAAINKLECVNDTSREEPVNATVVKDAATKSFIIQDEVPGTVVDPENLMNAILVAANALDSSVDMNELKAYKQADITIDSEEIHDRLEVMNTCLDGSITYDVGSGRSEVLDKNVFFDWITIDDDLNVSVDEDSVIQYVDEFSSKYDDYGCGKYFTSSFGVTVYIPNSEGGWYMDKTAEVEQIIADIQSGEKIEREANYIYRGNSHDDSWWGGTYIEVSITHQHVWIYSDYECVFSADVVTGCEANGTETWTGIFYIKNKMSGNVPLVGEDYVSYVTYWMAFNGGEGFHDATWRSYFGGDIYYYSGSHGCVNMNYYDAAAMYDIVYVGMPVIVYKDNM